MIKFFGISLGSLGLLLLAFSTQTLVDSTRLSRWGWPVDAPTTTHLGRADVLAFRIAGVGLFVLALRILAGGNRRGKR